MPLLETLNDDFNDNSIDAVKWDAWGNSSVPGSVTESGGTLNIESQLASRYLGLKSQTAYDLTASYCLLELVSAGIGTITSHQVFYSLEIDANNRLRWMIEGSGAGRTLSARYSIAGAETTMASATYSNSTHRWLRYREASGTCYWDYSADGTTWTNFASVATPIAITAIHTLFMVGNWQAESTTTITSYDNINLPPAVPANNSGNMLFMF